MINKFNKFDKLKEKGTYFEGSGKKYPDVDLPKWMQQLEESEEEA